VGRLGREFLTDTDDAAISAISPLGDIIHLRVIGVKSKVETNWSLVVTPFCRDSDLSVLIGYTAHERKQPVASSANFHFCETGCLHNGRQTANVVSHHAMAEYMIHQEF
jgi:hypothetical protein